MAAPPTATARDGLHLGTTPWSPRVEPGAVEAGELLGQAEFAESLGLDSFWLPERHFAEDPRPAPLLELSAIAARTRRILLGTTSYLLPIRQPLLVAEEVAVLDRLTGGRLILGLGRGFRPELFQVFGVDPSDKRPLFERGVETMLDAWRGEPLAGSGLRLSPLPCQRPHPPIWVAAFGPKALQQAGRLGLPYLASPLEPYRRLCENLDIHRAALRSAGHDARLPVPIMRTVFTSERPGAIEQARAAAASEARRWRRLQQARGVDADDGEPGSAVVIGEPKRVFEEIARYRDQLGMTHLIVRPGLPGIPPGEVERSLQLLAALPIR